jgi:WD40 repeat protein/serine/threonine protein kinase
MEPEVIVSSWRGENMNAADPILAGLSDAERQQAEAWLRSFTQSWSEDSLAALVKKLPPDGPLRRALLVAMVKIDLERQWERGRRAVLEAYLKFYPELGTADTVAFDLIQAEYHLRQRYGAVAKIEDFARRFPHQVERLREALSQESQEGTAPPPVTQDTRLTNASTPSEDHPPASTPDLPPQFGRYQILRCLGKGGMGAVYLAQDSKLDRPVALKVPFRSDENPVVLERFYREARAAANIEHPNICPVYDVGEIEGRPYLTMAYVEGKPLTAFIDPKKLLSVPKVVSLVRKVCLALAEAHSRGVIHRDLKPSNIMINRRGEPVIMDFGLARRVDKHDVRLTVSGALMGTPSYMAPEQVTGQIEAVGAASDIYALGVIFYELLTAQRPFEGSLGAVFAQILTQPPQPPSQHRHDLDPKVEAICLQAMAKEPAQRYASMTEFAKALSAYQNAANKRVPQEDPTIPVEAVPVVQPVLVLPELVQQLGAPLPPLVEPVLVLPESGTLPPPVEPVRKGSRWPLLLALLVGLLGGGVWVYQALLRHPDAEGTVTNPDHPQTDDQTTKPSLVAGQGSALDALNRTQIPAYELRMAEDIPELVAILGDSRMKPSGIIDGVLFSPDGKHLATTAWDRTVKLWDPLSGQASAKIRLNGDPIAVGFSPDGKRLYTATTIQVFMVELATGKQTPIFPIHTTVEDKACFNADATRFACRIGDELTVFDTATGLKIRSISVKGGPVAGLALNREGNRLASTNDKEVRVWETTNGLEVFRIGPRQSPVKCVCFSSDGKYLASGGNGELLVSEGRTGKDITSLKVTHGVETATVSCVSFSSDGKNLAAGTETGNVIVWNTTTWGGVQTYSADKAACLSVCYSPDGRWLGCGGKEARVWVWDTHTEKPLFNHDDYPGDLRDFCFSAEGKDLVTGHKNGIAQVWHVGTGQPPLLLKGHSAAVRTVDCSSDGQRIVTGGEDLLLHLWDSHSGEDLHTLKGHVKKVLVARFSPDGKQIVSGDYDNLVKTWDAITGKELFSGKVDKKRWVLSMAFTREGIRIASGENTSATDSVPRVVVWNLTTETELFAAPAQKDAIGNACFSSDGSRLALAREEVSVRDAVSGKKLLSIPRDSQNVAFSPDGQMLATVGPDQIVEFWDAQTGQPKHKIVLGVGLILVKFAPDGRHVAVATRNGTVYILRLAAKG